MFLYYTRMLQLSITLFSGDYPNAVYTVQIHKIGHNSWAVLFPKPKSEYGQQATTRLKRVPDISLKLKLFFKKNFLELREGEGEKRNKNALYTLLKNLIYEQHWHTLKTMWCMLTLTLKPKLTILSLAKGGGTPPAPLRWEIQTW